MILHNGSHLEECVVESPNQRLRLSLELLLMCLKYLLTSASDHGNQNLLWLKERRFMRASHEGNNGRSQWFQGMQLTGPYLQSEGAFSLKCH